ncbi:MAG: hypothetical protein V4507_15950, partial [Verrucomicrobiota bacterium]
MMSKQWCKKSFSLILVLIMISSFFILITSFFSFSTSRLKILKVRNSSYKVDLVRDTVVDTVLQEIMRSMQARDSISFQSFSSSNERLEWGMPKERKSFYLAPVQSSSDANTLIFSSGRSDGRFTMDSLENKNSALFGVNSRIEDEEFWERPQFGKMEEGQIPRWIYLQENSKISSDLVASSKESLPSVRFGFALYDIGGLLDIQVAGRTASQREMRLAGNPTVAYADLTQLPGFTQKMQEELITFRNSRSSKEFLSGSELQKQFQQSYQTNGLIGNPIGENGFTTRQDLIRFFQEKEWPMECLKYLTTFSRS